MACSWFSVVGALALLFLTTPLEAGELSVTDGAPTIVQARFRWTDPERFRGEKEAFEGTPVRYEFRISPLQISDSAFDEGPEKGKIFIGTLTWGNLGTCNPSSSDGPSEEIESRPQYCILIRGLPGVGTWYIAFRAVDGEGHRSKPFGTFEDSGADSPKIRARWVRLRDTLRNQARVLQVTDEPMPEQGVDNLQQVNGNEGSEAGIFPPPPPVTPSPIPSTETDPTSEPPAEKTGVPPQDESDVPTQSGTDYSDVEEPPSGRSSAAPKYALSRVFPNPVRADQDLTIEFKPRFAGLQVQVLDAQGRSVWSYRVPSGATASRWDCTDSAGRRVSPGVYYIVLMHTSSGRRDIARIIVL